MRARALWTYVGMIIVIGVLVAFATAPLSQSFGQGKGGASDSAYAKSLQAHGDTATSLADATSQLDKAKAQAKTPFEKEMTAWGDKVMATMKKAHEENAQTLATQKAMQQEFRH